MFNIKFRKWLHRWQFVEDQIYKTSSSITAGHMPISETLVLFFERCRYVHLLLNTETAVCLNAWPYFVPSFSLTITDNDWFVNSRWNQKGFLKQNIWSNWRIFFFFKIHPWVSNLFIQFLIRLWLFSSSCFIFISSFCWTQNTFWEV